MFDLIKINVCDKFHNYNPKLEIQLSEYTIVT